ncbi:two-component sensor histidine kinase [Paenibacillus sp. 598K]|uniref:sensor histidine kinase n=1 Tax=Paenibacillus sp. 598K TaxID=1117987 RepID=UPI000FF9843E|nr:sensor histidine kinase [Paenibacillus sp. 598K]GBF77291.1 two-component sensor histidine kinase [Paenibacillus sp. 598K]
MRFIQYWREQWSGYTPLRNNMFVKLMVVFALISVLTIAVVSYSLYVYLSRAAIGTELDIQKKAIAAASSYLEQRYETVQSFMNGVYRDSRLAQDLVYYLQLPFEDYIRYRLDQSYESLLGNPRQITVTLRQTLQDMPEVRYIMLYSAERQTLHVYSQDREPVIIPTNASRSYIPDVMASQSGAASVPNVWIRRTVPQLEGQLYSFRVPINDPGTMRQIGQLMFYYDARGISAAVQSTAETIKGNILVLSPESDVIYDSSGRYYGADYPYMEAIQSIDEMGELDEPSYITRQPQSQAGFIVAGVAPVREVAQSYEGMRRTILVVSLLSMFVVVVFPSLFVLNVAKRTYQIIRFMRKAEQGNLGARLQDKHKDELGQIASSFNRMLEELSRHIEREYKAEIRQKHAELAALQARINPHFLHNTLEVIRMRAVARGVHDVGEMIYALAMLFRSFVRPEPQLTLTDELENCRLYLELFRLRYQDHLTYEINYDLRLGELPVPRMLIQPVIENYIVHGLRIGQPGNKLSILASEREGQLTIEVRDNGMGIESERLEKIVRTLELPEEEGESFGLRSVHERIRLLYGVPYGIRMESERGVGTTVWITIPAS